MCQCQLYLLNPHGFRNKSHPHLMVVVEVFPRKARTTYETVVNGKLQK